MTLDDIKEEIVKAQSIVILTHESPDGDAVGSSMAAYLGLKQRGKNPDVIIPEYSRIFEFLPEMENIKKKSDIEEYDLAIALDCADLKRLEGKEYFENAKVKVVIDHHGSNTMYGDYNYVNPASPACCEILAEIIEYFEIEITKEIGTAILTGIITDTGGFKYDGVTSETFEFTSELLRNGVKVSNVYKKVLQTKTRTHFELEKLATSRMQFLEEGKIAFTYITCDDEKNVNAETGDHEGLVEIGRDIEGVEVSVFLRGKEGAEGFKVSLRSKDYLNVSDVCFMFGGGGHPKAAGCFIPGTVEQVKDKIVAEIKKSLK